MARQRKEENPRTAWFRRGAVLFGVILIMRLFWLQVIGGSGYSALALNQRGYSKEISAKRGEIFLKDKKGQLTPLATNEEVYLVYANGTEVRDAKAVAKTLSSILDVKEDELLARVSKNTDMFEPLQHGVTDDIVQIIKGKKLAGINFIKEHKRVYPFKQTGSQVVGFVGASADERIQGRYGLEAQFEKQLGGEEGSIVGERDPSGRLIPLGNQTLNSAKDGADLVLTIDPNIQFVACERLRSAVLKHGADSGSVVIMDPKTGAIMAMCGVPDFDPNNYGETKNMEAFNNPIISKAYEPGSVFKVITMAAAVDAGKVTPNTTYEDTGEVKIGPNTIRNSDNKANGRMTMSDVLAKSLNTGAIFAMRTLGLDRFASYVKNFGFGSVTGLELPSESSGDISNILKKGEIYRATGSFGQGISVTPLQMLTAVGAIANGGTLVKPYIVSEIRRDKEIISSTQVKTVRQVISVHAATLLSGMMVKVVEEGHGKRASVPGYWVGGKTGTAQIPGPHGGYDPNFTIGSFVGFAPVEDPRFVMITRIDRPRDVKFAESSAAPLFGDIASFLVQYLDIRSTRPIAPVK